MAVFIGTSGCLLLQSQSGIYEAKRKPRELATSSFPMSQGLYPVCFLLPTFQGLLVLILYVRPRCFSRPQWGNGESTSPLFQSQICGHGNFTPVFVLPRRSREGELPSYMNLLAEL